MGRTPDMARTLGRRSPRWDPRIRQAQWRVHDQYCARGRARAGAGSGGRAGPRASVLGCGRQRRISAAGRRADENSRGSARSTDPRGRQPLAYEPQTAAYFRALGPHAHDRSRQLAQILPAGGRQRRLYPRFGPTSEWDTAAGQAVLEAAGGQVTLYGRSSAALQLPGKPDQRRFRRLQSRERAAAPDRPRREADRRLRVTRRLAQLQGGIQQGRNIEHHLILGHGQTGHAGCGDQRRRHVNLVGLPRRASRSPAGHRQRRG